MEPRPSLVIHVGSQTYTAHAADAPITIGREFPAQVRIEDDRISRTHMRLDCTPSGWVAVDQSRNGIFIDGARHPMIPIRNGTTIYLGNPQGIPVAFTHAAPAPATEHVPDSPDAHEGPNVPEMPSGPGISSGPETSEISDGSDVFEDTEHTIETSDPGVARAGAAVAARREELKLTQRHLARSGIVNAGALIDFEKGRRWPRKATLAKLEDALQWPQGTIARIRRERTDYDGEDTVALTNTIRAPLMAQAVELALATINTAIEALPAPTEGDFSRRATGILADLRKLEGVAADVARSAKGAPEVALVLSSVRRGYKDLMLRAARAPGATLGQRLYAARYRAELTVEETANAAGVPPDVITAAEAEVPLDADTLAALSTALTSLTRR
jgi:transcriptional regulator with XRE-family HTH domain